MSVITIAKEGHGELAVAAQHLALPIDEVHASASLADNLLVIVLGRILTVQPVLNPQLSVRTGEEKCGHQSNYQHWGVA